MKTAVIDEREDTEAAPTLHPHPSSTPLLSSVPVKDSRHTPSASQIPERHSEDGTPLSTVPSQSSSRPLHTSADGIVAPPQGPQTPCPSQVWVPCCAAAHGPHARV